MSSVASKSSGAPPPAASVHVHWRDRRGGNLIQDATHIGGDVHKTFLIHQNEGMFLEERHSELKDNVWEVEEKVWTAD